jgi:hypothetical protein
LTFPISAGVYVTETNLTDIVPAVSESIAALAGIFAWGPCFQPNLISSQTNLVNTFGRPSNLNAGTWFSASNFLDYGNAIWIVRTANTTTNTVNSALNAVGNTNPANILNCVVLNEVTFASQEFPDANVQYIAKYPGALGNTLRVGQCDSAQQYIANISLSGTITSGNSSGNSYIGVLDIPPGSKTGTMTFTAGVGSNVAVGNLFANSLITTFGRGDVFQVTTGNRGNPTQFLQALKFGNAVTNATVTTIPVTFSSRYSGGSDYTSNTVTRYWQYWNLVSGAPGISPWQANSSNPTVADQLSIVVIDEDGLITGTPNTVLETYNNLSRATDSQNADGSTNFYKTVINQNSPWIWIANDRTGSPSNTAANLVAVTANEPPLDLSFTQGQDGDNESVAPMQTLINGWTLFTGKQAIDIDLVIAGVPLGANGTAGINNKTYNNFGMASWLINNLVQHRGDCVLFFSPDSSTVVNNVGQEAVDLVNWASLLDSSTFAFMDSGWKYQYDNYNNIFRWLPLNGDIAGCAAYTDAVSYPWFSIAGFNRGQIKNVIKLAYNPQETDRDFLYPNAVNPVVTFPGQGTYLYGDKTFTQEPTAFGRINVRRLFITIEKAISKVAQYSLFEINDVFTQNQLKNQINPYLKGIMGARGITDFIVICDATNNTPQVVDSNQLLCGIYVKPARSINFLRLDFVAVPDGVSFSTVENASF